MSDNLVSLYKLESLFSTQVQPFDKAKIKAPINSFYLNSNQNEKYVKPNFTEIEGSFKNGKIPQIILVTAAGATGKSELTKYLSATLSIPIFDLAKHDPVASNSLTGLFYNTLGHIEIGNYIEGLKSGENVIIVDALDEGYIKTTIDGFNSFLSEIGNLAKQSKSTPFVILGRTQVLEHAWLYFDDMGVATSLFKIEPFTVSQATEFIDKQVGEQKYDQQYKLVRDYVIESVEGFFKTDTDIVKKNYNSFIGYAPVLLSITKLLSNAGNYIALYQELHKSNHKGVDLIISIIEYIIQRDKEEKIDKLLLPSLLNGRSQEFTSEIYQKAYSCEEQCARLLYHQLNRISNLNIANDVTFDSQYEERIKDWVKEHPFLEGDKIQNAVFESYIISKLVQIDRYYESVIDYLNSKYKDSFVLFFIFNKVSKERKVKAEFIQYLLSSLKSLDIKDYTSQLEIEEKLTNEDGSVLECELTFIDNSDDQKFIFEAELPINTELFLGTTLSNVFVNAPIKLAFRGRRCELAAPITISCNEVRINTSEFVVEKSTSNTEGVLIECNQFVVDYTDGHTPRLLNHLDDNSSFQIFSENRPDFPFVDYYNQGSNIQKVDPALASKYLKLRKIIMQFRSHSKGVMAKIKDKIEHRRVIGTDGVGLSVLDALIQNGVLTSDTVFYYVDDKRIHEVLGVSYLDLKRKTLNEKISDFLNSVQ